MSAESATTCPDCGQSFYYDPRHHRCPGEWESIAGGIEPSLFEGMSWVDECMAKQYGKAVSS